MKELLKQLIAQWGIVEAVKMINQIVTPNNYFEKKFFTDKEGKYADNLVIPIMRGDTIIMEAIPSGAPRPVTGNESIHKLNVELARFADEALISVKDLKHLASFNDGDKQAEEFAVIIGRKAGLLKNKFTATKEFMRLGAILGTVRDGSGKTLFEFRDENIESLKLGSNVNPEAIFEEYEDDLVTEFGYTPDYMMLTDREMYNGIYQYAVDKGLVKSGLVKKVKIDGVTEIDYAGRSVRPITNAYGDVHGNPRKFIENKRGILVPVGADGFKEYFTHAEHIDAIDGAPAEYFSKVEEMKDGEGVKLIAESVCIPINTRPYSVRNVKWN
ncbi:major capsid protein [Aliarcobacter vitoriensis]|uniref:Phage major capsid protein E n=1 Tax=Aliarcobacter vitoriensis TaxID=2011099 RepID=A0A366MQ44_9BACT|nr:major capsid protein [Aliarcobacter vitoriensis]RBQ28408.1 hypothetical protein CRU91_09310 [Aliarcobacter vitoriensis]